MKRWWRRLSQGLVGAIGGAIGGPIGSIITLALFELAWPEDDGGGLNGLSFPSYLEAQLNEFIDKTGERITYRLFYVELNGATKEQLTTKPYVDKVNFALQQLAILKAYCQFVKMQYAPDSDGHKLESAKIHGINHVTDSIIQAYETATAGAVNIYKYGQRQILASNVTSVEQLDLDWMGAKIYATTVGYFDNSLAVLHGGDVKIGRGGTTTKEGDSGRGTKAGGTIVTGGATTTKEGGTVNETTTTTTTEIEKETTPLVEDKTSKRKGIIAIGIGILAGVFIAKSFKKSKR